MGHLKNATVVYFLILLSKTCAFQPILLSERLSQRQPNKMERILLYKRLYRINTTPTFLPMSAGPATPDGRWSSSSEDVPQDMTSFLKKNLMIRNEVTSHHSYDKIFSLHPQPLSPERQKRIESEEKINSRFLQGDQLFELRDYIKKVEQEFKIARENALNLRIFEIQKVLEEARYRDAEYVYKSSTQNAIQAERMKLYDEAEELWKEAIEARSALPQYNLEGLWVERHGDNDYEMINVTYVNDTLIATKVMGDKNVPKGGILFTSNLSTEAEGREELTPIELSDAKSKVWGQKHLTRFPGKGQVARKEFKDDQDIDGQLILVGDYFSFAWIPLGQQSFFGRPSAELVLRMLKQSELADFGGGIDHESKNGFAEMRLFAQRCFEETEMLIDDDVEGEVRFDSSDADYFSQDGCFQ